jgi:hypothetical protein
MTSSNKTLGYLHEMNATPQYLVRINTHSQDKPVTVQLYTDMSFNFLSNQMQEEAPTKHGGFHLLKQFISVNIDSEGTTVVILVR